MILLYTYFCNNSATVRSKQGHCPVPFFILLFFISALISATGLAAKKATNPNLFVRVLLEEKKNIPGELWTLTTRDKFTLADLHDATCCQTVAGPTLRISRGSKGLLVNGKAVRARALKITSLKGPIKLGAYQYNGSFLVIPQKGTVLLINKVEFEDYVACGVRWEMMPGWPAPALEAGAIAYRTYVITTLRAARARQKKGIQTGTDQPYDIRCTPVHQTYKGTHACTSIHEAVKNSKGLIVAYHKEPIVALYDACCGGIVPQKKSGIDFEKAPYLARSYACRYCKDFKFYTWSCTVTLADLTRALGAYVSKKGPIADIKIVSKDKSGTVEKIKVRIGKEWYKIPAAKLPASLKGVKSCLFSLARKNKTVTISGKGYGHQMGFCQWGAYGLAKKRWNYKKILQFYYPGTTLMKAEGLV